MKNSPVLFVPIKIRDAEPPLSNSAWRHPPPRSSAAPEYIDAAFLAVRREDRQLSFHLLMPMALFFCNTAEHIPKEPGGL